MTLERILLDVEGMSCAACVRRVERAVLAVPGIEGCSVNLAANQVTLTAIHPPPAQPMQPAEATEGSAPWPAALQALAAAGYPAQPHVEPSTATEHADRMAAQRAADDRDLRQAQWALLLTLPLVAPMLLQPLGIDAMAPAWLQWALATPVQWLLGARFYRGAWQALKHRTGSMDQLVVLGTTSAYGLSVWLWQPWAAGGHGAAHHGLYFEASAVVIALVLLGKALEARAKRHTVDALNRLRALRPDTALLEYRGVVHEVPLQQVQVGDTVVIRPGQRVPVDGTVVDGRSHIDESALTGESLPVARGPGDRLVGGTLNGEGLLRLRTDAVGAESALARIVRLVEQAQAEKAPIQALVDRISTVFVPTVVVIAVLTLLVWGVWVPHSSWEQALLQAVSVLVIACPCALGLATPATLMVALGVAARHGLLVRDAQTFQRLADVRCIAWDKTGTLTQGHPVLRQWLNAEGHPVGGADQDWCGAVLRLQEGSSHPLARALQAVAAVPAATPVPAADPVTAIETLAGWGQQGQWRAGPLRIGSLAWMRELGLSVEHPPSLAAALASARSEGATVSAVAWGSPPRLLGLLTFTDTLRPEAPAVLEQLRARGIRSVVLSGDHPAAVHRVAQALGLERADALSEQTPAAKAQWVTAARAELAGSATLAMVGDGINDAPALARADAGMAMPGTDVAMDTAGITLMRADLRLVVGAIGLAQATRRTVRYNLFWAFAFNAVGIPLAACGLLSPVIAGTAMAASSVMVLGNALRLRSWQPQSIR